MFQQKKEIRVTLRGGLGNQLFQFSAARLLAGVTHSSLTLLYESPWNFELAPWNLDAQETEEFWQGIPYARLSGLIERKLSRYWHSRPGHYHEKSLRFTPEFLSLRPPVHLHGYFQDIRYVSEESTRHFLLNQQLVRQAKATLLNLGIPSDFVAIHVRGGDYRHLASIYRQLDMDFYSDAIGRLVDLRQLPRVVFSNELEYARGVVPNADFYIGPSELPSVVTTMFCISLATGIVGANSTFSWFAARLAETDPKSIVFPLRWYNNKALQQQLNILNPEWQAVPG